MVHVWVPVPLVRYVAALAVLCGTHGHLAADARSFEQDSRLFIEFLYRTGRPPDDVVLRRLDAYAEENPDNIEASFIGGYIKRYHLLGKTHPADGWHQKLLRSAEAGNSRALACLGYLYMTARDGPGTPERGREFLERAVTMDEPLALYFKGFLLFGTAVRVQDVAALERAEISARQAVAGGCLTARTLHALSLESLGRCEEALQILLAQVDMGDPQAEAELAVWYSSGRVVEQSDTEAFRWMSSAAEKAPRNRADLITRLAMMYRDGRGIKQDLTRAFELFSHAYDEGDPNAGREVARALLYGQGAPMDGPRALEITRELAELGAADAQAMLGRFYLEGIFVPRNLALAREWMEKAAANGDATSGAYLKWLDLYSVQERNGE